MTTIATGRLVLGPFAATDLDALNRWENDAEILAMSDDDLGGQSLDATREMLAKWMLPRDDVVCFAIRIAATRRFIGFIHLARIERAQGRCRTGFCIGEKDAWGRGYGTETLRAAVAHAFGALGLRRIGAEAYADNPRSIALLERVGFRREGVKREYVVRGAGFVDELEYGLLRSDWISAAGAG